MSEIKIDLSEQKFEDGHNMFSDKELILKNKNYIFAKNGSGKSTLTNLIASQKADDNDVKIFQGFDSVIGENNKLNAIDLYDSEKDKQNKNKISKLDDEVAKLSVSKEEYEKLSNSIRKKISDLAKQLEKEYSSAAKEIKNDTNYQVDPQYNKTKFKADIKEKPVRIDNIDELMVIIGEKVRPIMGKMTFPQINTRNFLESTNQVIGLEVETKTKIAELDNNSEKQNWVKTGLTLHKNDDICAFCGSGLETSRKNQLKKYFDADEVLSLQLRIKKAKVVVEEQINNIENIKLLNQEDYYAQSSVSEINKEISIRKSELKKFFNVLFERIDEKERNIFNIQKNIQIKLPDDFGVLESKIDKLVNRNNDFSNNIEATKKDAKNKIRMHLVCTKIDEKNLKVIKQQICDATNDLEKIINKKKTGSLDLINSKIIDNQAEITMLKSEIANPEILIKNINKEIRNNGHGNLQLKFVQEKKNYQILNDDGSTRDIQKISTGEKNIIAFLYFCGELSINERQKNKIIIFDDPMNSNDDTMQYLIISKLQKFREGKEIKSFDPKKDFLLILTHNVHFYMNVQPYGSFKDTNKKTKYDKNNFYYLQNGNFRKITNQKDDITTHYDALWNELGTLLEQNLRNSVLNSMRRIIETYLEFTQINRDKFYKDNEHYLKLFNVNSHSAIDDESADSFTESAEELKKLFKQIFVDNDAVGHFNQHWVGN